MTDNAKKVSELPIANSAAATDRILLLKDPAGAASSRTITVNNFIANVGLNILGLSIPGPFANDLAANTGSIPVKGLYYDDSGTIKLRLT